MPAKKSDEKAAGAKTGAKSAPKTAARQAGKSVAKATPKAAVKAPAKASETKAPGKRAAKLAPKETRKAPGGKSASDQPAAQAAAKRPASPRVAETKEAAAPVARRKPGPKPKVKSAEPAPDGTALMMNGAPRAGKAASHAAQEAFQDAAQQSGERMAQGFKDVMAQTRRLFEAQSESFAPMYLLPQECARFYAQRVKANLDLMNALAACREPGDAMAIWTEAAQRALEDYQDEMRRLGDFMTPAAPKPSKD